MGDATRFGVSDEGVTDNYISGSDFRALFASVGHITLVGKEKSRLMDEVMTRMYGMDNGGASTRLGTDLARARKGEPVYCPGAREILFPDGGSRADPPSQHELGFA